METYGKCEWEAILPDIIALNRVDVALRAAACAAYVRARMKATKALADSMWEECPV